MALQQALAFPLALLAAAGGLPWRAVTPLPVPIGGHAAGRAGSRLLVAGGTTWQGGTKYWLREVRAYDLQADRWTQVGLLPEALGGTTGITAAQSLYVIGGSDGQKASASCYRLRFWAGQLVTDRLPDLPEPRVYAGGARVGRFLYVVGGCTHPDRIETATSTLFALDVEHPGDGWMTLPPLPGRGRITHATASVGGRLYVFGGCYLQVGGIVRNLADAYRYDPRAAKWERLPDAPRANRAWTATGDGHGGAILVGGFTATEEECAGKGDDFGFTDQVLRYDTLRGKYREVARLPVPNCDAAPVRVRRELYLIGGEPVKKQRADAVLVIELRGR
jgi:N-acetylneuraminic acid mutarotase